METIRKRLEIVGIVQGVGFRPYLFRLAAGGGLSGTVRNTSGGVEVEVQGAARDVEEFVRRLPNEAPPLARIFDVTTEFVPVRPDAGFTILKSRPGSDRLALILADVATCDACLKELFDPADRRHLYPFINCTECGPRFTITRDIPYDRALTSMADFAMCGRCRAEYEDPNDRRFHAQPIACPDCGPKLWLHGSTEDPISGTKRRLSEGLVVAVKGLGGFHLAVHANDDRAVRTLRERKHRAGKPLAVMVRDLDVARRFCELDARSASALTAVERPIVLLRRRPEAPCAPSVAPGLDQVGLFLPYTPLHHLLFREAPFDALVMTSGNLSEEPIAADDEDALERLGGIADAFLLHDRRILHRTDDSVVRVAGRVHSVRRSRGFVPVPILLNREAPPIIAAGGELKSTICLTRGRFAFLSSHVGDLENVEALAFFQETVAHFENLLGVAPKVIAHDLHPHYFSTRWAMQQGLQRIPVQHHHAHIAACMAEHRLEGRVIGVALDGTGYGPDGTIWGGEILLADYERFERAAHLAPFPLPGGTAAIKAPWKVAAALLHHLGMPLLDQPIDFARRLDRAKTVNLLRMIDRGFNSPMTSSCGRLFDAVAALVGLKQEVSYEGEAAILLEAAIDETDQGAPYVMPLTGGRLETGPLLAAIVRDLVAGVPGGAISRRFHDGLVESLRRAAAALRDRTGIDRVCLGGGCFQNGWLLTRLEAQLVQDRFSVYVPETVPANDGGISLGQAAVAARCAGAQV